jgi:hypothetical protein
MKINWRVLIALVVMVTSVVWAFNSVRAYSYSGTNLKFPIGNGSVTLTNPSAGSVPSQLLSTGSRTFSVSSNIEGVSDSSTRQQSGSTITQLFEFALPPGVSVLTVSHGTPVNFAATSDTRLQSSVDPLSNTESNTTMAVAVIVLLGGLFYISRSTGHRWIRLLIRKQTVEAVAAPIVETPVDADPNRGRDGRMYSNYGAKD